MKKTFRYDLPIEIYNMLKELAAANHQTMVGTIKQLILAAHRDMKANEK